MAVTMKGVADTTAAVATTAVEAMKVVEAMKAVVVMARAAAATVGGAADTVAADGAATTDMEAVEIATTAVATMVTRDTTRAATAKADTPREGTTRRILLLVRVAMGLPLEMRAARHQQPITAPAPDLSAHRAPRHRPRLVRQRQPVPQTIAPSMRSTMARPTLMRPTEGTQPTCNTTSNTMLQRNRHSSSKALRPPLVLALPDHRLRLRQVKRRRRRRPPRFLLHPAYSMLFVTAKPG